jgi:hypothetical protein
MTRGIIKLPLHGSGFYSNYFSVLSMAEEAHRRGLVPYVDLSNTAFVPNYNPYKDKLPPETNENPWNWWFSQQPLENKMESIKIDEKYSFNLNQTKNFLNNEKLNHYRAIAKKYFQIHLDIQEEINKYYTENIDGKITLGVMARGAEMNKVHPIYGNHNIDIWIKETKKILDKNKEIKQLFLVTEEEFYVEKFKQEFDNVVYLSNVFRRTNEDPNYIVRYPLWACLNTKRKNHTNMLGRESLVQAILLSKCDYLLGKHCGTVSAAIFFSSGFKKFYYSDTNPLLNTNLTLKEKIKFFVKRSILGNR